MKHTNQNVNNTADNTADNNVSNAQNTTSDTKILQLIEKERIRQQSTLQMIPSENYVSKEVLAASGSILTNKYAEGYPKKRYYQGNIYVDEIELLAIERAKKLFHAEHANVQPYSGSPANQAIFHAVLKPGDKIMGMRLDMGGHLTHGHSVNFSSRYFQTVQYTVNKETQLLDLKEIHKIALQERPKLIIVGATAYPRIIDFKAFHTIAHEINAYLVADISHIAGLIIAGDHPHPFPYADIVMTTTHKTLRGPRGAVILCKKQDVHVDTTNLDEKEKQKMTDLAGKIDRAIFPGLQGGPHEHIIAAKAIAFHEALQPEFTQYAHQIIQNAKTLAETLLNEGLTLVANGTDTHLILIDLTPQGIGLGKSAAIALEEAGIITNANTVPYDQSTPFNPSGIRLGTPALTTRGMKEPEMQQIGTWTANILNELNNKELRQKIKQKVETLCQHFPLYA